MDGVTESPLLQNSLAHFPEVQDHVVAEADDAGRVFVDGISVFVLGNSEKKKRGHTHINKRGARIYEKKGGRKKE